MKAKRYIVVETLSFDGESICSINVLKGPFDTNEKALAAFSRIAKKYEEGDASVDMDNYNVVSYEGNGEIHNILVVEIPA